MNIGKTNRLKLAFTLSSAVLRLDSTAWLQGPWTPGDFLYWRAVESTDGSVAIETYVSKDFASRGNSGPSSAKSASTSQSLNAAHDGKNPFIRNTTLFNLALILIELCFNRSIEDLTELVDQGSTKNGTHFRTALRLVNSDYIRIKRGIHYQDAVKYCLLPLTDASLAKDEMQQKFLSEVIIPLDQTCKHFGVNQEFSLAK
jgi:hypothetical protein